MTERASTVDRKRVLFAALCVAAAASAAGAAPDSSTGPAIAFDIAPGDLTAALTAFAQQSHLQILFDARLVAGRRSRGIDASTSPSEALASLLAGSGIAAEPVNAVTYVLKPAPVRQAPSPRAAAPEREPPPTELLPVQVTGSHIRRTDWETASPVAIVTREDIERSGRRTLSDVLRAQVGLEVAGRPEVMAAQPGASYAYGGAAGAASVGMSGLGVRGTLVLIDGRRVAGYGLTQAGSSQVVDLDSIPLGIVDRIEILRDGASAAYGADAIGGVVNVILRRAFSRAEAAVDYGISSRGDAQRRGASVTLGSDDGPTHVFVHAGASDRDPLVGAQRDWYTLDRRAAGLDDRRGVASYPGNYVYLDASAKPTIAAVPGCAPENVDERGLCRLDQARYTTLQTASAERSLFVRASRDVSPSLALRADVRLATIAQDQQAAPVAALVTLPAGASASPYRAQPLTLLYAFADVGPVRERTVSTTGAVDVGVDGIRGTWTWNANLSLQRSRVVDSIDGFVKPSEARLLFGQGGYVFGASNADGALALLSPPLRRRGRATLADVVVNASGPVWELPGGTAQAGVGIEARHERVDDEPDALLRSDDRLFGERSFVQRTRSESSAAYVELELPATPRVTGDVALRYDRGAATGSAVSPKLGLRWRWSDALLLRATATDGYRPPSLLERSQPATFAGVQNRLVPRALGPCARPLGDASDGSVPCSLDIVAGPSPAGLRAETSRGHTIGLVYAPNADVSVAIDRYRIGRRNEIGALPLGYALQYPDEFPRFLRYDADGRLAGLDRFLVNLGRTETRGVDLAARYRFFGDSRSSTVAHLDVAYAERRETRVVANAPVARYAGHDSNPRVRARIGLDWTRTPWTATASVDYVGPYDDTSFAGDALSCSPQQIAGRLCRTPGFATLDLGVRYGADAQTSVALDVRNAFDHRPRYYGPAAANYNPRFDDPVGRYYSLMLNVRF